MLMNKQTVNLVDPHPPMSQVRIGSSMQLTRKHVHAVFANQNKFKYKAALCPVPMDHLENWDAPSIPLILSNQVGDPDFNIME